MVLIVAGHANYLVIGLPVKDDILTTPLFTFLRVFAYQLGVVAVDCFVFISGWFTIKNGLKKGGSLIIQSLEYGLGLSFLFILLKCPVPKEQLIRMLFIGEFYWFIIAYLQLLIVAPILNTFIEEVSQKTYKIVIISFFVFEFVYGWIGGVGNYEGGYSGIHFIGVYLLAQYIRRYVSIDLTVKKSLIIYLVPAVASVGIIELGGVFLDEKWTYTTLRYMIAYNSPLILYSSIGLFFIFKRIEFKSRTINWLSSSVLAIYLIHLHPQFFEIVFTPLITMCDNNALLIIVFVVLISIICILIDKVRIIIEGVSLKGLSFLKKLFSN